MTGRKKKTEETAAPPEDPRVKEAFTGLMNTCQRAVLDLFDHDCTCVFHDHTKEMAKHVKKLLDLQKPVVAG